MATKTPSLKSALDRDRVRPGAVWFPWPDGWRCEISTALIDAIYSARATYKTRQGRGIYPLVSKWRESHTVHQRDSLTALVDEIADDGPLIWAERFGNSQHSPRRSTQRPESPWKSSAILEAAQILITDGVESSIDVDLANHRNLEVRLREVPGIGEATSTYFMMLLGIPGVKADVMIRRYVGRALGAKNPPTKVAVDAVSAAADAMGVELMDLEHTIWEVERDRSA
ncbi:hypothetical protein [Ilumatobacter nonamiensis]|uniref:hypothetical protein n=1 Tax=Ilumatobacter nonamiensis TaxID=467093 RepID=UPI0011D275CF|nr:hypothetical protein [Ilumatobacter nonamiensis]